MSTRKYKSQVVDAVMSVKQTIDTSPCQDLSNAFLASTARISRKTLQEVFKDLYGTDIGEYKLKVCMQEAKHLLRFDHSIKQIAIELHYASPSAFSNAFKNYFNVRPSEWLSQRDAS